MERVGAGGLQISSSGSRQSQICLRWLQNPQTTLASYLSRLIALISAVSALNEETLFCEVNTAVTVSNTSRQLSPHAVGRCLPLAYIIKDESQYPRLEARKHTTTILNDQHEVGLDKGGSKVSKKKYVCILEATSCIFIASKAFYYCISYVCSQDLSQ